MSFLKQRGLKLRLAAYICIYLSFTDVCACARAFMQQSLSIHQSINMHVTPSIPTQLNFKPSVYNFVHPYVHISSFLQPKIDQIPGRETAGKVTKGQIAITDNITAQRVCGFQLHPDPADHFAEKHGRGEVLCRPLATSRLAERVRK